MDTFCLERIEANHSRVAFVQNQTDHLLPMDYDQWNSTEQQGVRDQNKFDWRLVWTALTPNSNSFLSESHSQAGLANVVPFLKDVGQCNRF